MHHTTTILPPTLIPQPMLQPQLPGIILLEPKIPNPFSHRQPLPMLPQRIRLRAPPPNMLQYTRRQRPANLPVLVGVALREHIHIPNFIPLVPRYQVSDAGLWKDESLRAAAEFGHRVHALGDWEHRVPSGGEEEGD